MKVLFDTNIVLDVLLKREPFYTSASQLMSKVEQQEIEGYLSATTITTVFYLLAKSLDKNSAQHYLKLILQLFQIAAVNQIVIEQAVLSNFRDFEDAVLYQAAKQAQCEMIITRNLNDFKLASIPVMTAEQFLIHHMQ